MMFVVVAALCSVLVSVLLKLAKRADIAIDQAVAWNYVTTTALTLLTLQPSANVLQHAGVLWLVFAALGVLLPTIFLALAASVRHAGIVRSDAAQRLSLLIPLLAAFTLFGETPAPLKLVGCALGLLALLAMVWRTSPQAQPQWRWPLLVFFGFGVIDVLFKRIAAAGIPLGSSLAAVFSLALLVAFLIVWKKRSPLTLRSALAGLLLGLFNFSNILFYLKAHRALPEHPALVFASMNLGVVTLGTAVGVLAFRERLSRINALGVLLALLAIFLLTRA